MTKPPRSLSARSLPFEEWWRQELRRRVCHGFDSQRATAESLGISEARFSRLLRGTRQFTPAEFIALADRFELPLRERDSEAAVLRLRANANPRASFDPEGYLAGLETFADRFEIERDAVAELPCLEVLTTELPVFWLFGCAPMAAMKRYLFETRNGINEAFDLGSALARYSNWVSRAGALAERYTAIQTTEIWGHNPLDSTLRQLEDLAEQRALSLADASRLLDCLVETTAEIDAAVTSGKKSRGGDVVLLLNRLHVTSSVYVISYGTSCEAAISIDNPTYLPTADSSSAKYLQKIFTAAAARAHLVNRQRGLSGRVLAIRLRESITTARARIEAIAK